MCYKMTGTHLQNAQEVDIQKRLENGELVKVRPFGRVFIVFMNHFIARSIRTLNVQLLQLLDRLILIVNKRGVRLLSTIFSANLAFFF